MDIQQQIQDEIKKYMEDKQFNLSKIPAHGHTGLDVQKVRYSDLEGTPTTGSTSYLGIGVSSSTNGLPYSYAHGLSYTPHIGNISLIGIGNASISIQTGSAVGRVADGTSPGAGVLLLGTDSSNFHVISVSADATNFIVSKSTTGSPGNISFQLAFQYYQ